MRIKTTFLTSLLVAGGMLASAWATPPAPKNLGLDAFGAVSGGQYTFFAAREISAGADFNGDGDLYDSVLHVRDGALGKTTNLGLAGGGIKFDGRFAAFVVSEFSQGATDLNGDGDAFDQVLHVYDVKLGTTRNLGLAGDGLFGFEGGVLAGRVSEFRQGGQDLNGDGDTFDQVVHVHDANRGTTKNLGLASYVPKVGGGYVAFALSEAQQGGTDINGDGDATDHVMHVYDPATGKVTSTNMVSLQVDDIDGGRVLFRASEGGVSSDLNGDGDLLDSVPHVYTIASKALANLGVAGSYAGKLDGGVAAVVVSEYGQGQDMNGDGDIYDNVVSVYDVPAGKLTHLGLVTFGHIHLSDRRVALTVYESFQGSDLNGDGDAWDPVVMMHDMRSGTTKALGAGSLTELVGGRVVFAMSEAGEGATDLNGDGDTTDSVLHVHDAASGKTTNHGLAVFGTNAGSSRVMIQVSEYLQGGTDLNGDGDTLDSVVHVLDVPSNTVTNLKLAGQVLRFDGAGVSMYAFSVSEWSEGRDLNGDGDTYDNIIHTSR